MQQSHSRQMRQKVNPAADRRSAAGKVFEVIRRNHMLQQWMSQQAPRGAVASSHATTDATAKTVSHVPAAGGKP